jgi:hypothetical protein
MHLHGVRVGGNDWPAFEHISIIVGGDRKLTLRETDLGIAGASVPQPQADVDLVEGDRVADKEGLRDVVLRGRVASLGSSRRV